MRSMRRDGICSQDSLGGEHLHRVAFGYVVPAIEQDAAFEAFADFVHVVSLAPEGGDVAFPQLFATTHKADAIAAVDHAIGHDTAGNRAASGLERGAHLGVTVDGLLRARLGPAG